MIHQNESRIKSLTRDIIQKMLCSEYLTWPPTTPFGIYQPHRPERLPESMEKSKNEQ